MLARTDECVEPSLAAAFCAWLERRERGESVAYLFRRREFYGRALAATAVAPDEAG